MTKQPIQLHEYDSLTILDKEIQFSEEEIRIIERDFRGKIDIFIRSGGKQEIKAKEYVGYIVLPNHVINIRTKISDVSFFNMIRYALRWPELNLDHIELLSENNYYDILVHFLLKELEQLFQRGLYSGYTNYDEKISRLRGKILFKEQIGLNYNRLDKIYCSYSEISLDIRENQIIKYTLYYLSKCYFIDYKINSLLINYYKRLDQVELVPVNKEMIESIEYTPLNEHYKIILVLCELFLKDLSMAEEKFGENSAISFLIDMNELFQSFVANFLTDRLFDYKIEQQKEISPVNKKTGLKIKLDLLISKNDQPILVLDTKYKEFVNDPEAEDIYQLFYYCNRTQVENCCLIYPGVNLQKEYPQERQIMVHVLFFDLTATDRYDFEQKNSQFVNSLKKILSYMDPTLSSDSDGIK